MTSPWLSVIMPTYNGEAYLDMALQSIACQGEGLEVIALDDGSTDSTCSILNHYAERLNLRVESKKHVGNWVALSNLGLQMARADYVCFLHQDDIWLPNRTSAIRPLLKQNLELILHPTRFIDRGNRYLGLWRCPLPAGNQEPSEAIERLLVQNFIAIPAPVFSRRGALEVGGLDENLWYAADWDFWLKLANRGSFYYHPAPLAAFRVHTASQTMCGTTRAAEMRWQLELVLERHLNQLGHSIRRPEMVKQLAQFSIDINTALAGALGGNHAGWYHLACRFLALGLDGCHQFLRDSRIMERLNARVKARW